MGWKSAGGVKIRAAYADNIKSLSKRPNSHLKLIIFLVVPISIHKSKSRVAVVIFCDEYVKEDGTQKKLSTIKEDAELVKTVLKSKYRYKLPSEDDPTVFEPGQFENPADLLKTFEKFLKKWKRSLKVADSIDRFMFYYHGHGAHVLGQPCILTSNWKAIPLATLLDLVAKHINPNRYYVINDCCAVNKKFRDEETLERVEKAIETERAKDFGEKLIKINAAPAGYAATSIGGQTFTCGLVSALEKSLEIKEKGIPLCDLQSRLQEEQVEQGSTNYPTVEASLQLFNELFPL